MCIMNGQLRTRTQKGQLAFPCNLVGGVKNALRHFGGSGVKLGAETTYIVEEQEQ